MKRVVIAGAGLAAGSAAATLREEGFDGSIVVVGDEPLPPYDRPPLSKAYLKGENPDLSFRDDAFWTEHRIEMRLGTVVSEIDTGSRRVLAGGERLPYDALLIATGGRARRLRAPGADLAGLFPLRTLADARAIRDAARNATRAAVVGLGFIGAEVAASLRERGLEVVALEPFSVPLERVLGVETGAAVASLHREHGVDLRLGEQVAAFEGAGRLEAVVTASGARIECDFAVAGVGIEPNAEIAREAGLAVGSGVLVDSECRAGAAEWAAGDVAEHDHPRFGRIRVEHWKNAIEQGAAAARSMLGAGAPYDDVHWFWSDQYDEGLQYAGHHRDAAAVVFRGDRAARRFLAFYLDAEGIVNAVAGFNRGRDVRRAAKLIRARRAVDPALLADEDADLAGLAG